MGAPPARLPCRRQFSAHGMERRDDPEAPAANLSAGRHFPVSPRKSAFSSADLEGDQDEAYWFPHVVAHAAKWHLSRGRFPTASKLLNSIPLSLALDGWIELAGALARAGDRAGSMGILRQIEDIAPCDLFHGHAPHVDECLDEALEMLTALAEVDVASARTCVDGDVVRRLTRRGAALTSKAQSQAASLLMRLGHTHDAWSVIRPCSVDAWLAWVFDNTGRNPGLGALGWQHVDEMIKIAGWFQSDWSDIHGRLAR